MIPTLYILIGLPGSGKDYWVNENACEPCLVVSSDAIRKELFGSEEIQDSPDKVFSLMFSRTLTALKEGVSVIYNATNLKRKNRMNLIKEIHKRVYCMIQAVIIATPYEICLKRNNARARVVPESAMIRMYKSFQMPSYFEGFHGIAIVKNWKAEDYPDLNLNLDERLRRLRNISHDNPHHTYSIGDHNYAARNYIIKNLKDIRKNFSDTWCTIILLAAKYHDVGKGFCKTNIKRNGEVDSIYHYYCHENTGAYDYLCMNKEPKEMVLIIALLINLHMIFYGDEVYRKRIFELYNDKKLLDALHILNEADKAAH